MRAKHATLHKYDTPFASWLYTVSLDGCDEEFGSVDSPSGWVGQLGRHFLVEDSNGFVASYKRPRGTTMEQFIVDRFGQDVWEGTMNADEEMFTGPPTTSAQWLLGGTVILDEPTLIGGAPIWNRDVTRCLRCNVESNVHPFTCGSIYG